MQPARYILYDPQGQQVKFKGGTAPSKCIKVTPDAPKALLGIGLRSLADVEVIIKVEGVTDALKLWDSIPPANKS